MADVTLPQLGETVTEGTITQWFKQVGDTVAADEPLFEVSTDKVDTEVPSPIAGVVTEIRVAEGETVDVGTVIAVIGDQGAAPADAAPAAPAPEAAPAPRRPRRRPPPKLLRPRLPPGARCRGADSRVGSRPGAGRGSADACSGGARPRTATPGARRSSRPGRRSCTAGAGRRTVVVARRAASRERARHRSRRDHWNGSGWADHARGRARLHRRQRESSGRSSSCRIRSGARASGRTGTGRPRRTTGTRAAPAAAPRPAPAPARPAAPGERDTSLKLSKIRRLTGDHMVMSKATSPHAFSVVEVDFAKVDVTRSKLKDEWKATEGFSLTYLPFISRAIIDGLAEFPHLNASVADDSLIVHNYIDLGIAVDLQYEGLLAPVIRDAESKRLRAIAREISDLASRAKSRKLSPDEIQGGTFTISNNGSAGSVLTMPIINQPQVAIISTDSIVRKPVAVALPDGDEAIVVHPVGNLAMSWDHRAFDGAYAAGFLKRVKEIVETRDWDAEV